MSDFPEKAPDKTNAAAVVVIGLATTAVLWASVVALQSYFENTQGEIAAQRAAIGRSSKVRDLKAEHRTDLAKTTYADAAKGTLKRLNIETAKSLVVRAAKGGGSLIPTLGALNVATIPAAAGRPADDAKVEPAAPADAAPASEEPTGPRVVLTASSIVIRDKVMFETGSATILEESNGLLVEVAKMLIDNPQVELMDVEGHTDASGGEAVNKRLSTQRAKSVVAFLVKSGVQNNRLVAKGYGSAKPVSAEDTEEAHESNRRVEFTIVKQGPKAVVAPAPAP